MATAQKPQPATNPAPRPAAAPAKKPVTTTEPQREVSFLFDREKYMWMAGGIALIFIGFLLMSGGRSQNPHDFHYDEIFSFRRITLAPIVVMIGYIVEIYAIMKKTKETTQVAKEG
jgi:hypothetical protein